MAVQQTKKQVVGKVFRHWGHVWATREPTARAVANTEL